MDKKILDFLKNNRVCVVTVMLPDNTPHGAAIHYSLQEKPLQLFFSTDKSSRKCQGLLHGEKVKAAVVVGFSEQEWKTLQMEGIIQAVSDVEILKKIKPTHYAKHPNSQKFENDPATIFLLFTPRWYRYTDYKTAPVTVINS